MLLAAGRGERMRPLTDHKPKPLLEVGEKPLIVWHIENLSKTGYTDLVINHAHLGAQIEQALGDGKKWGVRIRYSDEGTPLETAGGIAYALHLLGNEPFAVVNGDIYCDYDFAHLRQHAVALQASGSNAHLVLVNNPPQHPDGDFGLDGNCVNDDIPKLTFSGIGIYYPHLFRHIARGSQAPLAPLIREQIALGKVNGEHHRGIWFDVGTPQRLAEIDQRLRYARHRFE